MLPVEQRVAVLDGAGRPRRQRGVQLGGGEVAHPVGADGAVGPGLLERAEGLGQGHVRVELVRQVQLNVVDPEPFQARVQLPGDAFRFQAVVRAGPHRVVGLGGELRPDAAGGDPAADRRLAAATAVGVGGVEVGEAELPGRVHQLERLILRQALAEEGWRRADAAKVAAAQRDAGNRETGEPEWPPDDTRLAHQPGLPLVIIRAFNQIRECPATSAPSSGGRHPPGSGGSTWIGDAIADTWPGLYRGGLTEFAAAGVRWEAGHDRDGVARPSPMGRLGGRGPGGTGGGRCAVGVAGRDVSSAASSGTGLRAPAPATAAVTRQDLPAIMPVTATLGYAGSYLVRGQGGGR